MQLVLNQTIFIRDDMNKTHTMSFHPSKTILDCKKEIEEKKGISFTTQRLLFVGKVLKDEYSFKDYGIFPDSTLYLSGNLVELKHLIKIPQTYGDGPEIFIKTLTGKTVSIRMPIPGSIASLKERIYDKEGIPCDQQRLVFEDRELQDEHPISHYNIQKESTVHMVLRRRGGGTSLFPFVDMLQKKMMNSSEEAPRWRRVYPGLNLRGKCLNEYCKAYRQYVWIPKGFGDFNMKLVCIKSCCPECLQRAAQVNNLGIFKCFYSVEGASTDSKLNIKRERASDTQMLTFKSEDKNITNWKFLQIKVEPIDDDDCILF